jgi:SpoVK/Ycf46/Vps4 family AAA+-type ATPase
MKKKNIVNLIKFHTEKNEAAFRQEAYIIAKYFDTEKNYSLSQYIMSLLSDVNTFCPQFQEENCHFLKKIDLGNESIYLSTEIEDNIIGIINAIGHNAGVNKFLFEGPPGTGKTETAKQIAKILERDLYIVDFDTIIDSKLGQTSKNIAQLFNEIQKFPQPQKIIILFDEIDAIAIDRINSNDLREMGRATSAVLKGLDGLSDNIVLIATTNLYKSFDRALIRRFDSIVDFSNYTKEDLIDIAEIILNRLLVKFKSAGRKVGLFKKILNNVTKLPYPGDLKNLLKTSLAFSDPNNEYDYLKRIYNSLDKENNSDLKNIQEKGFTVREIEILTGVSKSQISRKIREMI